MIEYWNKIRIYGEWLLGDLENHVDKKITLCWDYGENLTTRTGVLTAVYAQNYEVDLDDDRVYVDKNVSEIFIHDRLDEEFVHPDEHLYLTNSDYEVSD